jgi:transposase
VCQLNFDSENVRSVTKYEVIEAMESKKKLQLSFWIRENEKKCDKTFGMNILFTDKQK